MQAATPRTQKAEQAARSREKLLDAAMTLFSQRGYRDTTVQAIGEAAGVSRGSIFWHFGSKEGLLRAVIERVFTEWKRETAVSDVGDATGLEAVRRGLRSHKRLLTERVEALRLFYVLMFEALGPQPALQQEFAALHRDVRAQFVGVVQASMRSGEVRSDLDAGTVITLLDAMLGGIDYHYLLDPTLDLDRAYADLEAILERGLAPG